jgi:hypothetical protein
MARRVEPRWLNAWITSHVVLADLQQRDDVADGLALARHHHHGPPAHPHRALEGPGDALSLRSSSMDNDRTNRLGLRHI